MFFDFKKYFKNNRQFIALIFAAVVFLFIYAWFPVYTTLSSTSFASPDETANYFWIERVANEEVLQYFEPLNVIANDAVVPRSVRSDNGVVKPVSFLGIILIYGVIAKFLGMWLVPFLTPLLAVLGVLFFYGIVSEIFAEKKALLSALLLFSLAPYWYYASRGLFHNVLFVDLVLAGGYLFIISRDAIYRVSTQWLLIFSSGICFGLAIMTRASELIWIAPAGIIIVAAYGKKIHWRKAVLFFCGLVLVVTPMFYCNHALYGGALNFGYEQRENKVVADEFNNTIVADTVETQDVVSLRNFVLPFGFHPRAVWHNFLNYYVKIFWYLFWPALLGGILFIWKWKEKSKAQKLYFCDSGLLGILADVGSGVRFENSVYAQLRQLGEIRYYALRNGKEIDFILKEKIAFEVKETPTEIDRSNLASTAKMAGIDKYRLVGKNKAPNFEDYIWGGSIR